MKKFQSEGLLDNALPRFGIFIVPYYILGTESMIKSKLDTSGINQIEEY